MEKVTRDGKIAVLYSPGFGAGWFTWNTEIPQCLFDPEIVSMVEKNSSQAEIKKFASEKYPEGYWGGARGLRINWIDEGSSFCIEEYDGNESFRFRESDGWITA